MSDPEPKKPTRPSLKYAGAGFELAGAVGALCLLGYWVDRKFDTSPWGILIGAVVGIVGGLYNLIRPVLRETLDSIGGRKDRRGKPPQSRDD